MKVKNINMDRLISGKSQCNEIVVNEFTEESAQDFRDSLLEASKGDPQEPVIIYIDSYGGSVDALAKMIETMDEVQNPLITVVIGKAMSCGAILLSHGDMRFCGRHSRIMVHEISGGAHGDVHDIVADAVEMRRLNEYFMDLLAKNCNIKGGYKVLRSMIKERDGRDHYMNAEQAKSFGIIDEIGTPRLSKARMYQLDINPPKVKLSFKKSEVQVDPERKTRLKSKKSENKTKSKKVLKK